MNVRVIWAAIAIAILLVLGWAISSIISTSPSSPGSSSVSESPPASEAVPGVKFDVVPDTLRVCDPPKQVRVSWNAATAGVKSVKLFVVGDAGAETLFTFAGTEGNEDTGPWTKAGQVFILKDGDELRQCAKFVIGSEKCD